MNRHAAGAPRADGCQNVWLQRDAPKRTLLGRSAVAGFGLFMGEDVKSGTFLGEYKGEVITSDEADRRGKLYDKRGVSFLFNLNMNQVIDATRAGNKFRYVNHSSKRPNCGAKVLMAGCTHRIGMFAKRDVKAGEELFFDYGYNNKQVKFVQKEFEPPEAEESGPALIDGKRARMRVKVRRKRELVYLKGGKGTTERSRAKVMTVVPAPAAAGATTTLEAGVVTPITTPVTGAMSPGTSTEGPGTEEPEERRPVKSAEYVRDSEEDSDDDLGQEDEGTDVEEEEEDVDEEYEPESEESVVVNVIGTTSDVSGEEDEEEDDDEPPRRKKRVRSR